MIQSNFYTRLLLIAAVITLAACGRAHIREGTEDASLSQYTHAHIQNVKVYSREEAAKTNQPLQVKMENWQHYSRSMLETALTNSGLTLTESATVEGKKVLVVDLDIDMQYGNRALRWVVGFGAGKGGVNSRLTAHDNTVEKLIFSAKAESDLAEGGAGGDMNRVLKKNIEALMLHLQTARNK